MIIGIITAFAFKVTLSGSACNENLVFLKANSNLNINQVLFRGSALIHHFMWKYLNFNKRGAGVSPTHFTKIVLISQLRQNIWFNLRWLRWEHCVSQRNLHPNVHQLCGCKWVSKIISITFVLFGGFINNYPDMAWRLQVKIWK